MSYGRKPFYIIGTRYPIKGAEAVDCIEFFGPAHGREYSAVVMRDEIAQLVAALERAGELDDLLEQGRAMLNDPDNNQ